MVHLGDGSHLTCEALVVATGVSYRRLDAPGVERLTGAGVYYGAAMTEGATCAGTDVFVVGGANSAGQAALYFSRFARSVTMLVRADSLAQAMSRYLIDQIAGTGNIEVRLRSGVASVNGEHSLESVTFEDRDSGEVETRPAGGVFVFIGAEPRTDWLDGAVARDIRGFLLTGPDIPHGEWTEDRPAQLLETSLPGAFAVGDVRATSVKGWRRPWAKAPSPSSSSTATSAASHDD